jgi:hypothetical protein
MGRAREISRGVGGRFLADKKSGLVAAEGGDIHGMDRIIYNQDKKDNNILIMDLCMTCGSIVLVIVRFS